MIGSIVWVWPNDCISSTSYFLNHWSNLNNFVKEYSDWKHCLGCDEMNFCDQMTSYHQPRIIFPPSFPFFLFFLGDPNWTNFGKEVFWLEALFRLWQYTLLWPNDCISSTFINHWSKLNNFLKISYLIGSIV